MMTQPRKRIFTFAAVLVLGLLMAPMNGVRASDENLLAFTSSGHVLGFRSDAFFVASRDHALRIEFVGANPVAPHAEEMTPTSEFSHGAPPLARVTYANLWNGITLAYDAPDMGIARSTYALAPFANPDQILLRYNAPITLNDGGALTIAFATGTMRESAPIAWQEINQQRIAVPVEFALRDSIVGFTVGEYNRAHTLVIDPGLTWSTFLGGSGIDWGTGIAVDGSGNVYVSGYSYTTWGTPVRDYTSGSDAYAAMLNAATGALQWNTFLGGSGNDVGNAIAVDRNGFVYVAGYSIATTWGTPVRDYASGHDAFAARLDAATGAIQWNTFLGGSGNDHGNSIAVDRNGMVYVAGDSDADWGSPVLAYTSGSDGFAARLDTDGTLLWNTFLGGSGFDLSTAIAVDGGVTPISVYVTGYSNATWEGSLPPVLPYTIGNDGFVAKLDISLGALQWNTFLGGSGADDEGKAIAVDLRRNVYVGGYSNATWGSPVRPYNGSYDAFAGMLDADGNLQWNTFLGGSGSDSGYGIALDTGENVYVAGNSDATWGSPARAYTSGFDAFASKLNSSGVLQWNAFLGGSAVDVATAIAVDSARNVYMTGYSDSTWGSPVRTYTAGFRDAFVTKNWAFDIYLPLIRR